MMFPKYLVFLLILVGSIVSPVSKLMAWEDEQRKVREPEAELTPAKTAVAKFNVDFRVAIKAPAKTKQLRVWVPLPPNTENQMVSDRKVSDVPTTAPTATHT